MRWNGSSSQGMRDVDWPIRLTCSCKNCASLELILKKKHKWLKTRVDILQDISSTCSCALIRTTQKLTVVTQWLYDKQWKPRGQEDEIVWLANNALVAYVGVQLKQSCCFFKCMYCALHKEGTAYKTALWFFDCFNAELHSFKSSYWVPKWVFILQREIRSFIISLWQLKSQSCYTFAEILQDLIVSLFDRWSVYKCVYDTFTSYHFKPKKRSLLVWLSG